MNCLLIFEGPASILLVEEAIERFLSDVRSHNTWLARSLPNLLHIEHA
jgi:hypothetical protein